MTRREYGPDGKENGGWKRLLPPTPKWRKRGRLMGQTLWKQGHTILLEAQYDRWTGKGYHLGRIICHLPSSHAVRKTARTRPRIHHICRLAGSDEKVSARPPRPRAGDCEGYYPVERIGATSCGCSGFPVAPKLRATRLPTGWPGNSSRRMPWR